MQEAGYRTVALVDHPGINPELQFDQGFERWRRLYKDEGSDTWTVTDSDFVLDQFQDSLDELGEATFFLYLHLVYPHRPYVPPPPYDSMFGSSSSKTGRAHRQEMINAYDGEVRYTDEIIGRLAEVLDERRLTRSTWLIVTSDHGEGFWEHNQAEHGNSFFNELTRVPMILVPPQGEGVAGLRIPSPASVVDLKPTILGLAGLEPERTWRGGICAPVGRSPPTSKPRDGCSLPAPTRRMWRRPRSFVEISSTSIACRGGGQGRPSSIWLKIPPRNTTWPESLHRQPR